MIKNLRPINPALLQFISEERARNLPDMRAGENFKFDPYLNCDDSDLNREINEVAEQVKVAWVANFKRKPNPQFQSEFTNCCKCILLNLIHAQSMDQINRVKIGTRKETLDNEKRYRPSFMKTRRLTVSVKELENQGIIQTTKKGFYGAGNSSITEFALSNEMYKKFALNTSELNYSNSFLDKESVILKDTKAETKNSKRIHYEDTPKTLQMREALELINELLLRTDIYPNKNNALPFSIITDKLLYRVFNNCSFEKGGRFYGAWWQLIKSEARQYITINNQKTVELDYVGFNPSVLLAKSGKKIPTDPYLLVPIVKDFPELRDQAKSTLAGLLNSASGNTIEPKELNESQYAITKSEFRQSVKEHLIPKDFFSRDDHGLRLMKEESDLAESIMIHFVDQGIPILPIHDAFIVDQEHKHELESVMKSKFKKLFGKTPHISSK